MKVHQIAVKYTVNPSIFLEVQFLMGFHCLGSDLLLSGYRFYMVKSFFVGSATSVNSQHMNKFANVSETATLNFSKLRHCFLDFALILGNGENQFFIEIGSLSIGTVAHLFFLPQFWFMTLFFCIFYYFQIFQFARLALNYLFNLLLRGMGGFGNYMEYYLSETNPDFFFR